MSSEQIQSGMPVYGSDGQLVGTVVGMHGGGSIGMVEIDCDGEECRVPYTAIGHVAAGALYLPNSADQYRSQPRARQERAERSDSAEAVPLPPMVDEMPAIDPFNSPR